MQQYKKFNVYQLELYEPVYIICLQELGIIGAATSFCIKWYSSDT